MLNSLPTRLLTRNQLHDFLVQEGFPIGRSTLDKLCAPACGEGPLVAALWPGRGKNGYRPLYEAHAALNWARGLLKPVHGTHLLVTDGHEVTSTPVASSTTTNL
jgi:hypothetical protein